MTESIFSEKKKYAKILKDYYQFKTKHKPIGLIVVNDEKTIDFLLDGLEVLSCDFVIKSQKDWKEKLNITSTKDIKKDLLLGFDFILADNEVEGLQEYFQSGIVPIIPDTYHLSSILHEFDPLQNEGNSFIYVSENKWSMYTSLVRYLENYKFPYDNRNLVKNIINL